MTNLDLTVGNTFWLEFPEQPGAGYIWQLDYDDDYLAIEGQFVPDNPDAVGSHGMVQWLVTPKKTGQTILTARYGRPWEKKITQEVKYQITIT